MVHVFWTNNYFPKRNGYASKARKLFPGSEVIIAFVNCSFFLAIFLSSAQLLLFLEKFQISKRFSSSAERNSRHDTQLSLSFISFPSLKQLRIDKLENDYFQLVESFPTFFVSVKRKSYRYTISVKVIETTMLNETDSLAFRHFSKKKMTKERKEKKFERKYLIRE